MHVTKTWKFSEGVSKNYTQGYETSSVRVSVLIKNMHNTSTCMAYTSGKNL